MSSKHQGFVMAFKLKSPAFADQAPIPPKYTADGNNLSPPLEWSDPPSGTKSFALIVEDPDAPSGTFRHWGVYNIASDLRMLPEGIGQRGTERFGMAVNDFGDPTYGGPAPPKGHGTHHYHFKLAALDVDVLSKAPSMKVEDVWKTAKNHVISETELVGTYAR
jgi:Raf kinase inhibitor-like YbhB/YbcL family protein